MISVEAMHPTIGAVVHGVDLATLDAAGFAQVEQAFCRHAVLVFRGQKLKNEDHVRFSRMFGPLQARTSYARDKERIDSDVIADISNIDADGNILKPDSRQRAMNMGDRLWHTDGTFQQVPSMISLLYANEVAPEGGNTEFADMRAAYDALPQADKDLYEDLVIEHSIYRSREQVGFKEFNSHIQQLRPPAHQVMVRVHDQTGRRALYLASHASHILGWDLAEGRSLIERLIEFATQPQFVYAHHWAPGDLVMWDNRCTMHRARPFDDQKYRRVMQRTTVLDSENSVLKALGAGRRLNMPASQSASAG
ncbi:MAG: TauD/TfdA family dioxygenase [Burkholderiaceae bacterium]|nr:TauD/TfdA family dioxygenase [Burkholderiaceae bacterium]